MSKEHVDAYYQEVCQNYIEMNEAIKDMEDECNKGLVDPDKLEEMKQAAKLRSLNFTKERFYNDFCNTITALI